MTDRRKRVVSSKPTKNGCRTCRLRRIKCDETRPICLRCTSSCRPCVGFPPVCISGRNAAARQLLPTANIILLPPFVPSSPLDATDYERYAFDHFRRTTSHQMRQSTSRAWVTQLVLKFSLEIPVFRAIAALGSVHRRLVQLTHVGLVHTLDESDDAVDQYSRAVSTLYRLIENSGLNHPIYLEQVLCACILLSCCEILRNDIAAATCHLRFGTRISSESGSHHAQVNSMEQRLRPHDSDTASTLMSIFHFIEQSCIPLVLESPGLSVVPALPSCTSLLMELDKLRVQLARLTSASQDFRATLFHQAQSTPRQGEAETSIVKQYCVNHCNSRIPGPIVNQKLSARLKQLEAQHTAWMDLFGGIMNVCATYVRMSRPVLLMQIQHFYSTFLLATCNSIRECPNDVYHDDYCRVLDLTEQYLSDSSLPDGGAHNTWNAQTSFAVQPAILPALYLIAVKCRDSYVRRKAVQLLASTDRLEGFQKSGDLAKYAQKIVDVEEQEARALMGFGSANKTFLKAEEVPEAARFLEVVVSSMPARPSEVQIVGGRFAFERTGELQVVYLTSL